MKKLFFFAAALVAAVTVNAQTVTKELSDVANYIDFQALTVSEPEVFTATVPTSAEEFIALKNGTKLYGYVQSTGAVAKFQWNKKESYNTTLPTPEWAGVDSLNVGTMWRADSGLTMALGAITVPAGGSKLQVFYQPNGNSDRGVEILLLGTSLGQFTGSGVKLGSQRPAYVAEVTLPASSYQAGDIVVKVITNTTNIFGVAVGSGSTAVPSTTVAPKAQKIMENGQLIILKNGVKYNALGAVVE